MSAAALVAVALVVAGAATVQLAAGFGFGLAAVPLLALVIGPHDAVVAALGLATFTNSYQAWSGRHHASRPVAGRMLAGAVLGMPVGLAVFVHADDRWLGVLVGAAVLVAVALIARGIDLRQAGPGLDVAAGAVSGASTMSVGVNGPPLVFVLQARRFDPLGFRGTITTVFVVLDVVSMVVFALTGDLDADVLTAIAVALPGLFAGAALGIVVRRRLDGERFRRLVLVLLLAAGASAIVSGLTS